MATDVEEALRRVDALFDGRKHLEAYWQTVYQFMLPQCAAFFQGSGAPRSAGDLAENVFDSTAEEAADRLVNLISARLTPPWANWFRVVPGNDVQNPEEREGMTEALQRIGQKMRRALLKSNFYAEVQPQLLDRVVGGTGGLVGDVHPELWFRCMPLSDLALCEDGRGQVREVAQRMTMSLRDLEEAFPGADLAEVQRRTRDKYKVDLTVYYLEEREADGQFKLSCLLKEPKQALSVTVSPVRTRMVSRWSKVPGSPYGRGPGQRGLSDVRALDKLKELSLKQAVLSAAGVYTVLDDGVINTLTVSIEPGEMIPVASNDTNNPSIRLLPTGQNFDVSMINMENLRLDIKKIFMQDQFSNLERTPRSATEVAERSRLIAQDLGASISRYEQEVLEPVLRLVFYSLQLQGEIPQEFALDGRVFKVEFTSYLNQSQQAEDQQSILELAQVAMQFGQIDPDAGLVIDYVAALRRLAALKGLPADLVRTTRQLEDTRQKGVAGAVALQQVPGGENVLAGAGN